MKGKFDELAAAVEDAQGRAGRYAQIAAFLTAFLVSLGAMGLYRRSVRRQLEVAESHLDTRLEAEKTVGRGLGELHTLSSGQRVSFIAVDIRGRRIALRVWSAAS